MVAKTLFVLFLLYMCGQHKRQFPSPKSSSLNPFKTVIFYYFWSKQNAYIVQHLLGGSRTMLGPRGSWNTRASGYRLSHWARNKQPWNPWPLVVVSAHKQASIHTLCTDLDVYCTAGKSIGCGHWKSFQRQHLRKRGIYCPEINE